MSKRFAAARKGRFAALSRAICLAASMDAANDNNFPRMTASAAPLLNDNPGKAEISPPAFSPDLKGALYHFARHGLSAACIAHENAVKAAQGGDTEGSAAWVEVCRQFDRRLAQTVDTAST